MNIVIQIECDNIAEFLNHLDVIKSQTKRLMLSRNLEYENEIPQDLNNELDHNNCYGVHSVERISEEYLAGYNCGLHGANQVNSHFSHFSTKEKLAKWEEGKAAGERAKQRIQAS